MNQVQDLIVFALNNNTINNQQRQLAENQIFSLMLKDYTGFFLKLAQIVADDSKDVLLRQSAASVMKALCMKKDDQNVFCWHRVNPNVRQQIKDILLSNLISPNIIVMRAGANTVAQIAAIEIPRNQWPDIIGNLAENASNIEFTIRRASITTLGFICQELKNVRSNINSQACEEILGSLLLGLGQKDIVEISLNALRDSMCFLKGILENSLFCNKTLQIVFSLFGSEYNHKIYQILFEFGKECYHLLDNYVDQIVKFTLLHIRERNQNSLLALELWDTIGSEYLRLIQDAKYRVSQNNIQINNILQYIHPVILPDVMASILIINQSDYELAELREVAVKALSTFVSCGDRDVVDKITEGVSKVIQSQNAGERQASALLFGCLCQYEDKDYILSLFENGFSHLYQLINDNENIVKKNTLNGFAVLAQCFPGFFLQNKDIYNIFQHMITISSTNQDEDIRVISIGILCSITERLGEYPNCIISKQPDQYLKSLVANLSNNFNSGMNKQSNEKLIIIIMSIVMNTNKKDIITMLTQHFISQYVKYTNSKIQDKNIISEYIIALIHTCLLTLMSFTVSSALKDKIYSVIDLHIKNFGTDTEGINMVSAASICFKKQFLYHLDNYWGLIVQGFNMIDQKSLFKASLSCISDLARYHQSEIADKIKPIFDKLLIYMQENIDRQLKSQILRCFGDLCLGLKAYGQGFIEPLINLSNTCFEAVYQLSESEADKEYAQQLKVSLIEMYHCVIFAQNQEDKINLKLANHFPIISTFIVKTCDVKYKPTVEYLKQCLYLVFDSALIYSKHRDYKVMISEILRSNQISNIVDIIRKFNDQEDIHDLLVYIEDKMRNYQK